MKVFFTSAQSFCRLANRSLRAVISLRSFKMASSLLLKFFVVDEFGGDMVQIWSCWSMLLGLEHFPTEEGDAEGEETENFDPAL